MKYYDINSKIIIIKKINIVVVVVVVVMALWLAWLCWLVKNSENPKF